MKEFDHLVQTQGLEALRPLFPHIGPHDLSTIVQVDDKADGSLISTWEHISVDGVELRVKSKGSIESDHVYHVLEYLDQPENHQFKQELAYYTSIGFTVNMELCSPEFRIVLGYEDTHLQVLNVRNNRTGEYYGRDRFAPDSQMHKRWVKQFPLPDDKTAFVESIPDMQGIEGFVVRLRSGQHVKIKTKEYLALHHCKDSINSERRLYEAVLNGATDDLRAMFYEDQQAIDKISKMELFVEHEYNHLVKTVEDFHRTNSQMERKEFAILGQQALKKHEFNLAMQMYSGREVDFKDFMLRKWKIFGIKDEEIEVNDE